MTIYAVETAEQAKTATEYVSQAFVRNPFRLIGLDTEFYGGGYPDSILTHLTLSIPMEEADFVFELMKPGVMAATREGWSANNLSRIIFATHFGQEDVMLLDRMGCRIDYIWDSGIIANHLGLINTALKELVVDYDLVPAHYQPVTSYTQLLKSILPLEEHSNYFKKNGDIAQAYPLHLAEGENRIKVLAYAAQDGGLTQVLCSHLQYHVLPKIYDQHTLELILTAQFESAILLARNNAKGYNIDTKTLINLVEEMQVEVDELDVSGRELVREAMGWVRRPGNPLSPFLPKPEQIEMFPVAVPVVTPIPRKPFPAILLGSKGATIIESVPPLGSRWLDTGMNPPTEKVWNGTNWELTNAEAEHDLHGTESDRSEHDIVSLVDAGLGRSDVDRGCAESARPEPSTQAAQETDAGKVG